MLPVVRDAYACKAKEINK